MLAALWIAIRPTRTPFADYLALRWTSWSNFLIGVVALVVLVGGWDLLSRALGREVTPGFMGEVLKSAQADGALWLLVIAFCVAAPMSEEIFARGFLYRGWSESCLGVARRHRAVVAGVDRAAPAIRLVLFRRDIFHRPAARLYPLSQQFDLADDRAARPQQSRGDGADDFGWLVPASAHASAIAIGIVIAARIVCSVMICASSGASPPICRAST